MYALTDRSLTCRANLITSSPGGRAGGQPASQPCIETPPQGPASVVAEWLGWTFVKKKENGRRNWRRRRRRWSWKFSSGWSGAEGPSQRSRDLTYVTEQQS